MAQGFVDGHAKDFSDIQDEISNSIDSLDKELREINLKVPIPFF